LKKVLSGGGD